MVVSQSGETADNLACLREIKCRGVKTIGIINVAGSTIAREVDGGIYIHASPEISVASTKVFTSQVAAITILGIQITQANSEGIHETSEFIDELAKIPDEIDNVIKNYK